MSTVHKSVHQREDSHRPIDEDAPVHAFCIGAFGLGEEAQGEEDIKGYLCNDWMLTVKPDLPRLKFR